MRNVGKFVQEWREERGLGVRDLAQRVGTSRQNIENFEAGEVRHPRYLPQLAKVMGLSVEELLAMRRSEKLPLINDGAAKVAEKPQGPLPRADIVPARSEGRTGSIGVTLLNVAVSMGVGALAPQYEEVVTYLTVSESWLRRHASFSAPENLALVTGHGDSMAPTFRDGDVLMVDRGVNDVSVDGVYALALREELYVKRLQRRLDGSVLMISDNAAYPPQTINRSDIDFRILGRVVMAWNAARL